MKRCKMCKVPLEGFLYRIANKLFNIKESKEDDELCNKCQAKKE